MRHPWVGMVLVGLGIGLGWAGQAKAQPSVASGEARAPFPGPWALSVEWPFDGDDNANAEVAVRVRQGDSAWRDAQPLFRVPDGERSGFSFGGRFAGSIFGLQPATDYEVELSLSDPDGGDRTTTLMAQTRAIPVVDPARLTEVMATPDSLGEALASAGPGTLITLMPGTYGPLQVETDGTAEAPLVIQGTEGVIIDGDVRLDGRAHVWLFGVNVRGQLKFNNAEAIVLRFLHVEAMGSTGDGIVSFGDGVEGAFISDNVVEGRTAWNEASLGVDGDNIGEGIAVTGPGNVIAYNRVHGFRDCVSLLEDGGARRQFAIDIVGNDLAVCADDAIEADFAMGNVRVIGNRIHHSFIALSSQPSLGGPTYFIRNVIYNNIFQAFKPHRSSVGDFWYHNTVVKRGDGLGVYTGDDWSHARFRNNLIIGGPGGETFNGFSTGSGRIYDMRSLDGASSSFDYNGLGMVGEDALVGRLGDDAFDSLSALRAFGHEVNGTAVTLDVFEAAVTLPDGFFGDEAVPDFRLGDGAAVDRGEVLANINDGFGGGAPDLGAHERGGPPPHFGPRRLGACGDGAVDAGESCDDGNLVSGDGCDATCQVEDGTDAGVASDGGVGDGGAMDGGVADGSLPDGSLPDGATTDVGTGGDSGGCGCRVGSGAPEGGLAWVGGFLLWAGWRRRRRG